ncbi:MAG TPA: hypothetical protein PKV38_03040 [bacterium]|nr:hypothetical protein [bacterium]
MRISIRLIIAALLFLGTVAGPLRGESALEEKIHVSLDTVQPLLIRRTTTNVLTWPAVKGFTHFNLYRKSEPFGDYPLEPINGKEPITAWTNCDDIKNLIPQGSLEWNLIEGTLGSESSPFDPCLISGIPRDGTPFERLQLLARGKWKIAVVAGQGYIDSVVSIGTRYYYELRGVDPRQREEVILASDISIVAGTPAPPPPPASLSAQGGDSRILVTWEDVEGAAGFYVYRSSTAVGPYNVINETPFTTRFEQDLNGDPLPLPANGYIDYQRWDENGNPITHVVNGIVFAGPANGVPYYYKVACTSMLGYVGDMSTGFATATPSDQTPPRTPQEVSVTANDAQNQLELKWAKVTHDTDSHAEASIQGYRVFRYEIPDSTEAVQIGGIYPQPAAGILMVTAFDKDPILRPLYGERTFWYRIECIDGAGNVGSRSAAAAGFLNDVSPPASPKGVTAEGFEEFIRVSWDVNPEPDMDGYLIYRSLCEFGDWTCVSEARRQRERQTDQKPKECPEVFKLIGYVSQAEAMAIRETGIPPFFDDTTVPAGSPLCYAYLVKAVDQRQNQSGTLPPDPSKEIIVCQRLRDKTPPDPAVISRLAAKDSRIEIEWVGAPVQDVAAYHVYRAEDESGPYKWVGGMTVEVPPAVPVQLGAPYTPPPAVGCDQIPLVPREDMSVGTLVDKDIAPHIIYWYKVVGIDIVGNEGELNAAVPVSTFTFSTQPPSIPVITAVEAQSPDCALAVEWNPAFNPSLFSGFVVFRSRQAAGTYLQISPIVKDNRYIDTHVARGVEYWYKVLKIDAFGNMSPLSSAKNGMVSP